MPELSQPRLSRRQKLREIANGCGIAAQRYDSTSLDVLLRLVRLYAGKGIPPREALRMGLADPRLSSDALFGCVSKRQLVKLQRGVNPDDLFWLTGDKSLFYPLCEGMGLPVPETYALFGRGCSHAARGRPQVVPVNEPTPSHRRDWEEFFVDRLPSEFVIKPARSGFGQGVLVLSRTASMFANGSGRRYSPAELYDELMLDPMHERFVIQERLTNHQDLVRLTGTQFLQTVRMTTFVDCAGYAAVYYVNFKLIAGDNVVDNFHQGKTGNLVANVAPDTGVMGRAMTVAEDGVGAVDLMNHPKTGRPIDGFRLPLWQEAIELACRAALLFQPVRTIGWDVALTPRGPVLVEGNHFWNPFSMAVVGPQAPGVTRHGMKVMLDLLGEIDRAWAAGERRQ